MRPGKDAGALAKKRSRKNITSLLGFAKYLVRNARVNKLRDVRRLFVPESAELQHEVGDFQDNSGDPLVAWVDLKTCQKRSDHRSPICCTLCILYFRLSWHSTLKFVPY